MPYLGIRDFVVPYALKTPTGRRSRKHRLAPASGLVFRLAIGETPVLFALQTQRDGEQLESPCIVHFASGYVITRNLGDIECEYMCLAGTNAPRLSKQRLVAIAVAKAIDKARGGANFLAALAKVPVVNTL